MATELPHRHTLVVSLFIGTKNDLTKGMKQLQELLPDNVVSVPEGWELVNINPELVETLKTVFIEDKLKFTEKFEQHVLMYLGWVIGRRLTKLQLNHKEPEPNLDLVVWKWTPITETPNDKDLGNDS